MITMHINICPRDLYERRGLCAQRHDINVGFVSPQGEASIRVGVRIAAYDNRCGGTLLVRDVLKRVQIEVGAPGKLPIIRANAAYLSNTAEDWALITGTNTFYVSAEWRDDKEPPWWEELAGLDLTDGTFALMLFVDTPGHDYKIHGDVVINARRV